MDQISCIDWCFHSGGRPIAELPTRNGNLRLDCPVDRYLLVASTICFLAAVVHTVFELRTGVFRTMRFNFFLIGLGFLFQTAFLSIRGHELGRCPITNLFEVIIFVAWSVVLFYIVVGPGYRLSLMGAFTAPVVVLLQVFALVAPIDSRQATKMPANSWLEFH